jgi:hypothetical protein
MLPSRVIEKLEFIVVYLEVKVKVHRNRSKGPEGE